MTASTAPRLCLLLAASALTGCFDSTPDVNNNGNDDGTTQGAGSTGMTAADPTGDPTTAGPSGTTTGDSASGTTSGETGGESSGAEVTGERTTADHTSTGDGDTSTGGDDSESPSVESMMPSDGATGVRSDTTVLLSFSEPMDTASVEAALGTEMLGEVTMSWNGEETELTVEPDNGIPYASGTSPLSVEALDFTITLSEDATDVAGNALDAAWTATFSSARRLTVALSYDPVYTGGVISSGVVQSGSGDDAIVGDHMDNLARRGFFGFSIAPLPSGILEFEDAELSAAQWLVSGDPIPSLGSSVSIAHIAPEQLPGGAYNSVAIETLGAFSDEDTNAADNVKTMSVTANVEFDYNNAESHTQYRLSMTSATNFNSTTDRLRYNDEVLEVTYLLP